MLLMLIIVVILMVSTPWVPQTSGIATDRGSRRRLL